MTAADLTAAPVEHHDEHHHGPFIAHHFDTPMQQYDSGKLGIWLFLTTEILFFSGLFLAYTLYRYHHPEIFVDASEFLDKILGGANTIVLLFSSLTMAWAVRAAQLGNSKLCGRMILVTMVCAAVFLGIKAVEYSHKWDLNIWVISKYNYNPDYVPPAPEGAVASALGVSQYLVNLSIIPTILLVAFMTLAVVFRGKGNKVVAGFFLGMTIMVGGYFLGAVAGQAYESVIHGEHAASHDSAHATLDHGPAAAESTVTRPQAIGIFFSIYYCMTGLHAIHVIAGIVFLSWLYYRSLRLQWRPDYFGPVDYVGLYWHVVDLIWIYLFPLLYLIK